jgi:hypothetical protein
MSLVLRERTDGDRFSSVQQVATMLPDSKGFIVRSGIAHVNFAGAGPGSDWIRDAVSLHLDLQPSIGVLTDGKPPRDKYSWAIEVEQWAGEVALSSFDNRGPAFNAGWAVDGFGLIRQDGGVDEVQFDTQVAVSDDGVIYRISFHVALVGTLREVGKAKVAKASKQRS